MTDSGAGERSKMMGSDAGTGAPMEAPMAAPDPGTDPGAGMKSPVAPRAPGSDGDHEPGDEGNQAWGAGSASSPGAVEGG